jgi:selenium-binding protein 1
VNLDPVALDVAVTTRLTCPHRVCVTNSLYAAWDEVFYPDGVGTWMARLDADLDGGGLSPDQRFFPHGNDFRGLRVHQTRLQAGDASSDSYCFGS